MNGQTKSSSEKQRIVDEYILKHNPYKELTPLNFNLRQYARYVKENNLKAEDIFNTVMSMFIKAV